MNTQHSTRNVAVWVGLPLTLFGFISYFTLFVRWPALRDTAWLNLALVLLGTGASLYGAWCTFRAGRSLMRKLGALTALATSLFAAFLLCAYVFSLSSQLPAPQAATLSLEQAPDFSLRTHEGETVRLSEFRGQRVLLVFYRGYW